MTSIFIILLSLLALLGLPIFALLGGITLLLFHSIGQEIGLTMGDAYRIAVTPGLLALPLFVFTGYLLSETKISQRILRFIASIIGWLPGGVVIASMLAMSIFTAFTGISIVTIVTFGGILLPMMRRLEYSENFSIGFITSIGPLGILLPPCIVIVLYGLIAQVSIRGLYVAGIIPVLVAFAILAIYISLYSIKNKIPRSTFSLKELWESIKDVKWEAPFLIIILGGIFGGLFTISEAAAITVVYFAVVEILILKEVSIRQLPGIMEESMVMLGAIFLILGVALSFANYLVFQEIPMHLLDKVRGSVTNPLNFLIILNLFLLVVGMLIDMFTAIVVVVPLILPIAQHFDINPYHLGIVFLINLEIGYITPPVGINLFVSSMRFKKSIVQVIKSVIPFFIILIVYLAITCYWPSISTWLIDILDIRDQIAI